MRRVLLLIAVVLGVIWAAPAPAQVPTAAQLELLRTMSPEDREALLEQLGLGDTALDDTSTTDGKRGSTRSSATSARDANRMRADLMQMDKTLKALDSILIDIDFKKDKPPRVESQGEGKPPITIPGEAAIRTAHCCCRASRRSSWRGSMKNRPRAGWWR
jgi:hypothetical protein